MSASCLRADPFKLNLQIFYKFKDGYQKKKKRAGTGKSKVTILPAVTKSGPVGTS